MSPSPFATKGYIILSGTSAINLAAKPIFGLQPIDDGADFKIAAITHPSKNEDETDYKTDASNLYGKKLTYGAFYPIKATAITLTSGSAIGWLA